MVKYLKLFLLATLFPLFASCAYERVDAGYEGIKVNLYGDNKGVDDVTMVTGMVWYNPMTTAVYEYPVFVQTIDYEPFTINSKDGAEFSVDPSLLLKVTDGQSPYVFKKYRKSMEELMQTVILKYVKDACRTQLNKYTTDYIVSNREVVEKAIESYLRAELAKEHFELGPLTTGLKYPQSIVAAVNAKTKAVQDAQRAQNELAVAEANAKKKVAEAEGEARAYELKTRALSPLIIQQMFIDKWDGKLPVYGQVPQIFKGIQ